MKVYVILTNVEAAQTGEKGIEESSDVIGTVTIFLRVGVI